MPLFRSFLFTPGNHARRVEKALSLGADAVILDLEDAVAVAEKVATRPLVMQAVQQPRTCLAYVRVNAMSTEWGYADLVAVTRAGVDGIVLPKVETASELKAADWLIGALEREHGLAAGSIDLLPIIETALGFANVAEITGAGTRTRRIAFGAADFTFDLGITWSREEAELLPYRSQLVVQSRAAGLEPPIDSVWARLQDNEGFVASVAHCKAVGFQGKLCIHPNQVGVVNEAFSPTEAEFTWARRVVEAFTEAEQKGLASIQLDGRFIDYPIVAAARRVLEKAAAVKLAV